MKQGLKLTLASLTFVAAIAGASLLSVPAFAEQAAAMQELVLEDGTKVKVEGESVFVVGADGSTTPAPDGTHSTKDGQTITTKGGKIVK